MSYGYVGNILHVDLTDASINVEHPDEAFYRKYMGGSALGLHYVLKEVPVGADPLGPENVLVLAPGVMTGAPIAGQSRMTSVAKSPLTEAIGDAQSGGFFPAELKFAGFDAIVIRGRSETPVYLWIHNGEAELRSAEHLWGKTTGDVQNIIQEELGDDKIEIAQCGPAGESGVRFAAIMTMCNRANGRTGMGAVMGSKNLKAVAVRGKKKPELANRKAVIELARWGAENLESSDLASLPLLGTPSIVKLQNEEGGLPTRNWSSGYYEHADLISGETMERTISVGNHTCYACTVRCKRVVEVSEGPFLVDPHFGGPEYETLATFGSYCGVSDLAAIARANQLCNMYGLDTISCGATIAWAMDCYERGLLTDEQTGGIELRFGNADAVVELVEQIGERRELGDLLAEGSYRAAKVLGAEAQDLVVAVKGMEIPGHMPEIKRGVGLLYAVNPYGADHQASEHDPSYSWYVDRMAEIGLVDPQTELVLNEEKARFILFTQYMYSCMDSLNVCQFVFGPSWQLYSSSQLVHAIRAVTGWDVTLDELLQLGARRLNMLRAFNAREGFDRSHDVLPKKLGEPRVGGTSDGMFLTVEEIETAKDLYYKLAGWDPVTGNPHRETLEALDLGWVAEMIA